MVRVGGHGSAQRRGVVWVPGIELSINASSAHHADGCLGAGFRLHALDQGLNPDLAEVTVAVVAN